MIEHLKMIQAVIGRMATNSFMLKGWGITLVAGLLALGTRDKQPVIIALGAVPTLFFWGLDAYYLRQERRYRALYDHVVGQATTTYGLDRQTVDAAVLARKATGHCRYGSALAAGANVVVYVPLLLITSLVAIWVARR